MSVYYRNIFCAYCSEGTHNNYNLVLSDNAMFKRQQLRVLMSFSKHGAISLKLSQDGIAGASPHQGDLRLSGPPSGPGADEEARTLDRRVPADIRADSLATVPPTRRLITERINFFLWHKSTLLKLTLLVEFFASPGRYN
ncbi:hypothetical protein PoB_001848700 [Plakobranchus ocellatus]|uniref:Uncharacterized protein n=1 Tax=Plakobranchus ocellatus TaxID=259542 RepID=A0AAV3Z9R4_9GAST|nr:hypothetical protein PoB_001848700 [Plakobranchus ocellatus]